MLLEPEVSTAPASDPPAGNKLGLVAATALVIGNMIGSGIFLLPASLAPYGWNGVGGWILTIGGALVLAWVMARLTRALPHVDGVIGFVRAAFGPVPAFLVAWVFLVSIWTAVVTIAVAAVSYLSGIVPAISERPFVPALLAVVLLWALTLVNLRGVRVAGHFQVATVLLKLVPLVLVVALAGGALLAGEAAIPPFEPEQLSFASLNGAAALTLWALLGFECAALAAARVHDPQVNVPRATMWGTGLTGLLYLLVSSAIALMLPQAVVSASPAPFATFVERYWSAGPAALVAVFAIVSCVGALNGWTLLQGEMARGMAARGMLPAWFGRTDVHGTPRLALLVSAAIASLFALMNASRSLQGLFEFMLLLSTSAGLWLYLACALAALRLNVVRGWALIGAAYSLWTLWGAGIEASGLSLMLMLAGLPLYWWARRTQAVEGSLA